MVPVDATRVEVGRAGRVLAAAATVGPGAYTGASASRVRFGLVRLPAGTRDDGLRVRALSADGTLVGVSAQYGSELVTQRRVLLEGRSGRTSWSLRVQRVSTLAPTLADLEHETVTRCIVPRAAGQDDLPLLGPDCSGEDPTAALIGDALGITSSGPAVENICGRRFRLLHGSAPRALSAVHVTLGDGQVLRARVARVAEDGRGAYALVIPAHAAVRAVRLVDANGRSRTKQLGIAPLAVSCAGGQSASEADGFPEALLDPRSLIDILARAPQVAPAGPVTQVPGDPGFRVADGPGGTLCVAVAGRPFTALGCRLVAQGYDELPVAFDALPRTRSLVEVVPAAVATLRYSARNGAPHDVSTVEAAGYAGAYAGRVRFAAFAVDGILAAHKTVLLDAGGKVLATQTDDTTAADLAPSPRSATPRRIAGAPGGPGLFETRVEGIDGGLRCLALTASGAPRPAQRCQTSRHKPVNVLVAAPCGSRRVTVAVVAPARARVLAERTDGSTAVVRLRRGSALLTLGSMQGLRGLRVRVPGRAAPLRVPVHAPSGSAECGWTAAPEVLTPPQTPRPIEPK